MVLYENHLPSFRDGNGDGIGDLEGLIQSLDYLASTLGVTAIWVGPFYRSPLLDQGFDIADHCDVEPLVGDVDTVSRLVEEAHARGIKVILDYVPNHTSDQHPWFVESRSSRTSPMRDWYVWADAAPGRELPNNWVSEAGGSVWELDAATEQFYLHSYLKEQPDLNWRNPDVRAALLDVLRFWLDRGVDGFRIDVAHMLMKDPQLRDNPPNPDARPNPWDLQHAEFLSQLHVHDRMHPDLHAALREIRAVVEGYDGDRVTIGEIEAMDWDRWARYFGAAADELHPPFAFKLIETAWSAEDLRATIEALEAALPADAWPIFALGNHDRPRLASRLGLARARVAAMLMLTLRGTPTLLYADELGMLDQAVAPERQRDYFGLTAGGVSRDPSRTPMPWDGGPNGATPRPAHPRCGCRSGSTIEPTTSRRSSPTRRRSCTSTAGSSGCAGAARRCVRATTRRTRRATRVDLVERLGVDGFRVDASTYNQFATWAPERDGRASDGAMASLPLLRELRNRLRAARDEIAVYTESTAGATPGSSRVVTLPHEGNRVHDCSAGSARRSVSGGGGMLRRRQLDEDRRRQGRGRDHMRGLSHQADEEGHVRAALQAGDRRVQPEVQGPLPRQVDAIYTGQ